MDQFLSRLAARLQSEAINDTKVRFTELRQSESKTINIATVALGNQLFARIVPVTDDHRLLNAEVYTGKMTRAKLTHVSQDMLVDALVAFAKEGRRPNRTEQLLTKGKEPIVRKNADVAKLSDEQLDQLIDELRKDLNDITNRQNVTNKVDGDECMPGKTGNENLVSKTFASGDKVSEETPRPVKTNVSPTSLKKDGVVKLHGDDKEEAVEVEVKDQEENVMLSERFKKVARVSEYGQEETVTKNSDEFGPTRLNESTAGKVLVYTAEHGAIFVDKEMVAEAKKNDLKLSFNKETHQVEYVTKESSTVMPRHGFKTQNVNASK